MDTPLQELDSLDGSHPKPLADDVPKPNVEQQTRRDGRFWGIILSLCISTVLTALEFTAIPTALPDIVNELHGDHFIWVGSAYTLGSSALLPFTGGVAQIFGRRPVMLAALVLFSVGSAVCGAANSMNMLIAGRTVQGLGSGAITALVQIILADLVPLRERGTFNGLMALSWVIGGGTGPVIGGALAQAGQWRWLFYLNLPICGFDAVLIAVFLRMKTPVASWQRKFMQIDWLGNILIISSTTSVVLGLTWGGVELSWSSPQVLGPLIIGILGLCAFFVYDIYFCPSGTTPLVLVPDRTSFSGYLQNFLMGIVLATVSYWLAVYYQACKDAKPIMSGVDIFGLSYTISPVAIITGLVIQKMNNYRPPMWLGWALMIIGSSLLSTLDADSVRGKSIGYQIIVGIGIGIVYIASYFPVLASVPVTQSAPALAFFTFLRNFALVWGVTLGGAILQNELKRNLPEAFLAQFPRGTNLAFSAIPSIRTLPYPLKDEVRVAFADALQVVWEVIAGVTALGLVTSFAMKHLPLHTSVDKNWGRDDGQSLSADMESRRLAK